MAYISALFEVYKGHLELGVLYTLMALGVYITFRILSFPDLTVDGSFVTGGAIASVMITKGVDPLLATAAAFVGGCAAGALTGLLHTKAKINALLSGIIMMIALYSINLRIMGKANVPLLGIDTIFTPISGYLLWVMLAVVIVIKIVLDWFLHTEIGLALRATGDNARMIRSFGVNTDTTTIIGVSLSNGLVALSGALVAQYSGFADISMGVGMIVIGLASVIIGESLFGHKTVVRATLAVLLGAVVYRLIVAVALKYGFNPQDMKLVTALIVIMALTIPLWRQSARQKKIGRKRIAELNREHRAESGQGGIDHAAH